jgi:hypothetical protein
MKPSIEDRIIDGEGDRRRGNGSLVDSHVEPHEFVRRYINDNCIVRVAPGSKALPSYMNQGNGYYTWQFYLREALFNPMILNIVVKDFMTQHEELQDRKLQLCGIERISAAGTGIAK